MQALRYKNGNVQALWNDENRNVQAVGYKNRNVQALWYHGNKQMRRHCNINKTGSAGTVVRKQEHAGTTVL